MRNFYIFLARLIVRLIHTFHIKKTFTNKLIFNIGLNSLLQNKNFYEKAKNINENELKIYSQNGEDGIIDFLLYKLNILKPNFIEIGVGEYVESNTRLLYDRFYQNGLIIDCIDNLELKVTSNVNTWKGDLKILEKSVTTENIEELISNNCNFEVDLFSIDIDGVDYWIIKKINPSITKIFIAEYNSVFGDEFDISVPNIKNFNRKEYHHSSLCYGMSLKALIRIMKEKGFYFIGTNNFKNNAFFINKDFPIDKYFSNLDKIDTNFIKPYTDSLFKESRDKSGKLNFLSGDKRLEEIKECEIIDFSDNIETLKKIKDLAKAN